VRSAFVLVALGGALAPAAAAATPAPTVKATLNGTCVLQNVLNGNGVLAKSILTCDGSGTCRCPAAGTKLTYHARSSSPGTGVPAHENGHFSAAGPDGSVTVDLVGSRTSDGLSKGSWTLGKVSGYKGVRLHQRGTYATTARSLTHDTLATTFAVRISATIACWACAGQQ